MDNNSNLAESLKRAKSILKKEPPVKREYSKGLSDMNSSLENVQENYEDNSIENLPMGLSKLNIPHISSSSPMNISETVIKSNNLPKEILESFRKQQIDTSPSQSVGGLVLDNIGLTEEAKPNIPIKKKTSQPSIYPSSKLEETIEKIVKKYAVALKKEIVSNSNQIKAIKIGDKLSIIDGQGNIFESELVYKGNTRELKKK